MILLDTYAWVRWLHPEVNQALPLGLGEWLEAADTPLAVSVMSALKVSQLVKKGVLDLPLPMRVWFDAALTEAGIQCIPVTPQLLHASTILPDIHKDPADRIIIATAQECGARLVTADEAIPKYPNLQAVWAV
jgi:PIN domain nuclease of toxin-antitoxin system